jgi:putative peptidoglycan lipid II flippase
VILAILQTGWSQRDAAMTLAASVGIAGLAQLAMLFSAGAAARPLRIDFGSQTRAMLRAAVPGMVSGAGFQLLVVLGAAIASHQPAAVSWLYFASRLIDLPLGMIGALTGMVVMTESAHAVRGGDAAALQRSRAAGLGLSMALTLPAALGLWMLAEPIVRTVFVRGAFGPDDAAATARALQMLTLALPAQALARTMAADLFAHGETRMPMLATLLGAAVTLLAAALLPGANASVVALAIALGSWASATMLVVTAGAPLRNSRIGPICVSALAMAAMLSGALRLWPAGAGQFGALRLAVLIAGSVAAYLAALLGLGAVRCSELAALRRRGLRAGDARGNQPPLKEPQDFR